MRDNSKKRVGLFITFCLFLSFGCSHSEKRIRDISGADNLALQLFALNPTAQPVINQAPGEKQNCPPRRVLAFDIGSGSIKALVAEQIDCGARIGEIFYDSSAPVNFSKSLRDSLNISKQAEAEGFRILKQLILEAEQHKPEYWVAVATQAFRQAENGANIISKWQKELARPIQILTQEREGLLAFFAVKQLTKEKNLIVWDIGGGSQQIIWRENGANPAVFKSQLASVRFSEAVMELVKNEADLKVLSPNPLSKEEIDKSLRLAMILAEQQIPEGLKKQIQAKPPTRVFGIGGVHGKSLTSQVGSNDLMTRDLLRQTLKIQQNKTDAEIGGLYAATDVTNLILTLGFMEVMGLQAYTPMKMSLSEALVISSQP